MTKHIGEAGQSRLQQNPVADPPTTQAPSRHLTLVVDRDRDLDPVPALAAVGPSADF